MIAVTSVAVALLSCVGFFTAGYVTQTQSDAQARQLATLNRALEEYRIAGGMTYSHSLNGVNTATKVGAVINAMKAGFTGDDNRLHNFLSNCGNLDLTKLQAQGQGKRFVFSSLAAGAYDDGSDPFPYGKGVGYAANDGSTDYSLFCYTNYTSYFAVQPAGGSPVIYTNGSTATVPGTASSITFWACNSATDPTICPLGSITGITMNGSVDGSGTNNLTAFNVRGLTKLINISVKGNSFASLDFSGLSSVTQILCESYGGMTLTSLNLTGCSALTYLNCSCNEYLTSLNLSGCTALITVNAAYCPLATLNIPSGLTYLQTFNLSNDGHGSVPIRATLSSINLSNCPALQTVNCVTGPPITSTNVSNCPSLTTLQTASMSGETINITGDYAISTFSHASNAVINGP